jgi:hypothetical protein
VLEAMARAPAQLAESQLRAELMAEHYRVESHQSFSLYHGAQQEMARQRGAWELERAALEGRRAAAEREREECAAAAARAQERLAAFRRTRRYRLAQAPARPLERARRGSGADDADRGEEDQRSAGRASAGAPPALRASSHS